MPHFVSLHNSTLAILEVEGLGVHDDLMQQPCITVPQMSTALTLSVFCLGMHRCLSWPLTSRDCVFCVFQLASADHSP